MEGSAPYLGVELCQETWALPSPITAPTFHTHQHQSQQGYSHTITCCPHDILLSPFYFPDSCHGSPGETSAPLCGPAVAVATRQPEMTRAKLQDVVAQASSITANRFADNHPHAWCLSLPTPSPLNGATHEHSQMSTGRLGLQSLVSVMHPDGGAAGGWICGRQQPLWWPPCPAQDLPPSTQQAAFKDRTMLEAQSQGSPDKELGMALGR